jgi:hypothetical protein
MFPIRTLIAFLVAPSIPAAILTLPGAVVTGFDSGVFGIFRAACVVSYGHALIIGLPTYLILKWRTEVTVSHAAYAAFFIGIVPISLFVIYQEITMPSGSGYISNGIPIRVDGTLTFDGLTSVLTMIATFGVLGLLAGVTWGKIAGAPSANKRMQTDRPTAGR